MNPGKQVWHFVCPGCHYEMAILTPSINQTNLHQPLDESARETGLRTIRDTNFKKLLSRIGTFKSGHKKLLDVGCAHGWFLDMAKNQFDVLGIEPDQVIFDQTAKTGISIRLGYFPEVLNSEEKFDIIIFNDVIEHIPNIQSVLNSCYQYLNKNGLLVLNLPNSKGIFYLLSKLFCTIGIKGFFERMWQVGMPSPHVHYFNQKNLTSLLQNQSFTVKEKGRLDTLSLSGLFTRLTYSDKKINLFKIIPMYCLISLSLPLLKLMPSDITYIIAEKN